MPVLGRLVVVGLGLIGGSFAKGVRQSGLCREVVGVDLHAPSREKAVELGVVDRCEAELAVACEGADVIQLAVPIIGMENVLAALARLDLGEAIITDVGSAKGNVARAACEVFGRKRLSRFVPGHPIAGSEKSGVEAANASLFNRHKVILTPLPETDESAVAVVDRLWRALGADVEHMSIERHDEVLAATSHLPHLLAFNLVDSLARRHENLEIFRYAAGGFRDFTRIAGSDPRMWHDIFLANRDAVLRQLDIFRDDLEHLRQAVAEGDGRQLLGVFTRAQAAREHFGKILARRAYVEPPSGTRMVDYVIRPSGALHGEVQVPGDKSISHRAILLGSIAQGSSVVEGLLEGEDTLATLQALRDMGVVIEGPQQGRVVVHGVGLHGLRAAPGAFYLGSSGTSMRLLAGLLAGQSFATELTGNPALSRRSMARVAAPLQRMGAGVMLADQQRPPLRLRGACPLQGIDFDMPVPSAQVKSAVLLAGLYASGPTQVREAVPTRDHTERMLGTFGYPVHQAPGVCAIEPGRELAAAQVKVPGDLSSAAFLLVAASITPGSELLLPAVGVNPTRTAVIETLRLMGADIQCVNERCFGNEPVADLHVRAAPLKGVEIPEHLVPNAIDEIPALLVAAACAEGTTYLRGAQAVQARDTDRLGAMAAGLSALGIQCESGPGTFMVKGGTIQAGEVDACGDHRVAMALCIAAARASGPVRVKGCETVETYFPNFTGLCEQAGLHVAQEGLL
ncbi:3-phosphoshikimate 1-carboxyvinyltransferase [Pseudomonas sp. URIL14HWK12:I9]|nr:3-phosphoshikimate 1-carboxyvinyltransferase [Pseudomonas sp. URIL14HWK12:I12]PVZ25711.1 3-phosphoshikimate 1-carboxyvinyltransferase [Pseudomonas sp. URIL14HWK12:I10]PVZ36765.1 3-phosphoshikimate 1-carboxyvinyltransferase [Pseudomonas sp. URIL14HWK12:I11]SNZ12658.1 3-phosphoshikimate 1-carboxyvinyltransferase [Pseudomonas sp. URIL14HWK12:I9]